MESLFSCVKQKACAKLDLNCQGMKVRLQAVKAGQKYLMHGQTHLVAMPSTRKKDCTRSCERRSLDPFCYFDKETTSLGVQTSGRPLQKA